MAMGTRKDQEQQEEMWIPQASLAKGASHPFYQRLNDLLEESHFDEFVEGRCRRFYAERRGRPSVAPGVYFRLLLIGYFGGADDTSNGDGPSQRPYETLTAVAAGLGSGTTPMTINQSFAKKDYKDMVARRSPAQAWC